MFPRRDFGVRSRGQPVSSELAFRYSTQSRRLSFGAFEFEQSKAIARSCLVSMHALARSHLATHVHDQHESFADFFLSVPSVACQVNLLTNQLMIRGRCDEF